MQNISVADAKKLLDNNEAILIDVREPDEYLAERISCATLIPLSFVPAEVKNVKTANRKIIFQCKSGGRSAKACELVKGFFDENTLFNMEGGITAWKASGFDIESGHIKS